MFTEGIKTCYYRLIVFSLLSFVLCPLSFAHNDSIYMGTQVKLDIASPILVPATHQWQMQNYEVAVNVRLAKRFYPTFELGYAGGQMTRDTIAYTGHGGFFRAGCDLHPLKRHPGSPHALLVGVRLGAAFQDFDQNIDQRNLNKGIERDAGGMMKVAGGRADCWGEIVAGCQVEIAKVNKTAFYMGWMARFKCLFTRTDLPKAPLYIPGYGNQDIISWGANYYLGWQF